MSDRAFESLLGFIESEMAFESDFYNNSYLDRRITARIRRTDAEGYRAYRRLLERDDDERDALLDSLSINVTGFFRNPEAWERLRPVLRELTADGDAKIWSAPCADGREPYSVAMLAMDHGEIDDDRVSITATDINRDVLEVARRGEYEASQTTDIAAELAPLSEPARYVDRDGDQFRVREAVRELVQFEHHDLIRGDPKRDVDLVLCRNLLIYIDAEYKTPIFRTIRESLAPGGYLMIGMTETLPADCRDAFEPVDKRHRIYRRA